MTPSTAAARILATAARQHRLGVLAPFTQRTHEVLTLMPKPALSATVAAQTAARVTTKLTGKPTPVLVTSARLDRLLDQRLEAAAKIDQLTAKRKTLDADILKVTIDKSGRPDGIIETAKYTAKAVPSMNSHISEADLKAALLAANIKPTVIATILASAVKKTPYTYPRITRKRSAEIETEID